VEGRLVIVHHAGLNKIFTGVCLLLQPILAYSVREALSYAITVPS
jgi:hypothetical protein